MDDRDNVWLDIVAQALGFLLGAAVILIAYAIGGH